MKGTILFTDIKQSSVLWRKFPEEMFKSLKKNDKRIKTNVEKFDGMIVKSIGDSIMAKFDNAELAVNAAIKILKYKPLSVGTMEIKLRIGICSGSFKKKVDIIQGCKLQDFFGHTVNVAARLESNVSPINGFGIGFMDTKDGALPDNIKLIIKRAGFKIKEVLYKDKCPKKISKVISTECRLANELKGVGNLRAFIVSHK